MKDFLTIAIFQVQSSGSQNLSLDFEEDFPRPGAGRSEGLRVVLDAHTDLIESGSVNDDFEGFDTVVDAKYQAWSNNL